ncbi:hypothetical protein GQ53DRAFT_53249 [Thozetella sp. PMI_491]|nr:hypothetical protein GQ53DRAFT_53249 [Thozetella sp. PMI_491]
MPISRKKACRSCRVAKTRCSLAAPCARCVAKHQVCDYRGNQISSSSRTRRPAPLLAARGKAQDGALFGGLFTPEGGEFASDAINHALRKNYSGPPPLAGSGTLGMLPRSSAPNAVNYPDLWLSTADTLYLDSLYPKTVDTAPSFIFTNSLAALSGQPPQSISLKEPALPLAHGVETASQSSDLVRSLRPRSMKSIDASFTANVLAGQLLQYPALLISAGRLPPFIHPPCALNGHPDCPIGEPHQCFSDPLAVCAGLLHMFFARTPGNSDFVWQQIYAHQKRLQAEVCNSYRFSPGAIIHGQNLELTFR